MGCTALVRGDGKVLSSDVKCHPASVSDADAHGVGQLGYAASSATINSSGYLDGIAEFGYDFRRAPIREAADTSSAE